jgi:hypothetical protein
MPLGIDCKSCGARGFRSLGALDSHRSLACRGKAVKRARHQVDNDAAPTEAGRADNPAANERASVSNIGEANDADQKHFQSAVGADIEPSLLEPHQQTYEPSREHASSLSFNLDALPSQPPSERLLKEVRTEHFDDERMLRFV